jgi:hypothetical protein
MLVSIGLFVLAAIAVASPFLWRKLKENAHEEARIERGPHVRGRVVELREAADRNQELPAIGERPSMEVIVDFTTLDGREIRASKIGPMNGRVALRLLTERGVDVWYDPNNPTDATIRWESP